MTLVGELAQYFFLTKRQLALGELAPIRRPVRANSPTASWRCANILENCASSSQVPLYAKKQQNGR